MRVDRRPYLLEVNATPSMAVEHSEPRTERLIREQKAAALRDMCQLLDLGPERFTGAGESRRVHGRQCCERADSPRTCKGLRPARRSP